MTDAKVYICDATECSYNYGQTCSALYIELDEKGKCTTLCISGFHLTEPVTLIKPEEKRVG